MAERVQRAGTTLALARPAPSRDETRIGTPGSAKPPIDIAD